jgi:LytS/YehU family sensor histidine kinase
VLECRGRTLVPLAEELRALDRHRALASVRYDGAIRVDVSVTPQQAHDFVLPPVSLPELFQNALKHNRVGRDAPLVLRVRVEGATLLVENEVRAVHRTERSTGVGLENLRERFRLATGHVASWDVEGDRFVVRLPLAGR